MRNLRVWPSSQSSNLAHLEAPPLDYEVDIGKRWCGRTGVASLVSRLAGQASFLPH
jgi:hypothetical protein